MGDAYDDMAMMDGSEQRRIEAANADAKLRATMRAEYLRGLADAEALTRAEAKARRYASDTRLLSLTADKIKLLGDDRAQADLRGLEWMRSGALGTVPLGAFPRWADPSCTHEQERQRRYGSDLVCLDCGEVRMRA